MKVKIEENWNAALSREWESEYFAELVAFVKNEYSRTRIFPPAREIFAAFDACPLDRVKVDRIPTTATDRPTDSASRYDRA